MKSALPLVAVVVGLLLLIGSGLWGFLFPASLSWTEEKSQRMSELGDKAFGLLGEVNAARNRRSLHTGRDPGETLAAYKQATAELEQLRAEFENTRDSPKTAAFFLRWSGIACIVVGAVVVWSNRGG